MGTGVAWLSDDTLIASMLDRPSAPLQLWLVSAANGTFRRLTNDTSQYVGVNVTADRNALVTARAEYSFNIWTSDATATNWSQAVPTQRSKGPVGIGVRWIGGDLLYVSSSSQGFALTRWRASTQSEEVLAPGGGNPSVARDGSTIFFLDYDSRELWTMDHTGQNRVRIRRAMVSPEAAHVTPDGRHYVAIDTRAGAPAIVLAALDGSNNSREITRTGFAPPPRCWKAAGSKSRLTGTGSPIPPWAKGISPSSRCARLQHARPDGCFRLELDGAGCRTARRSRMSTPNPV
jgi:Tol biopolymer transport system component